MTTVIQIVPHDESTIDQIEAVGHSKVRSDTEWDESIENFVDWMRNEACNGLNKLSFGENFPHDITKKKPGEKRIKAEVKSVPVGRDNEDACQGSYLQGTFRFGAIN